MKEFQFIAMNRQLKEIYKSGEFRTYKEAYKAGCDYLLLNKEVKEIRVRTKQE